MNTVALCSFKDGIGWQVVAYSKSDLGIGVFRFGKIKLLRIPTESNIRSGHFCNPSKM